MPERLERCPGLIFQPCGQGDVTTCLREISQRERERAGRKRRGEVKEGVCWNETGRETGWRNRQRPRGGKK